MTARSVMREQALYTVSRSLFDLDELGTHTNLRFSVFSCGQCTARARTASSVTRSTRHRFSLATHYESTSDKALLFQFVASFGQKLNRLCTHDMTEADMQLLQALAISCDCRNAV